MTVRTYVDSSEREAYSVSEALAGDVAKLNEDVKGLQIMQQNLAQQVRPGAACALRDPTPPD